VVFRKVFVEKGVPVPLIIIGVVMFYLAWRYYQLSFVRNIARYHEIADRMQAFDPEFAQATRDRAVVTWPDIMIVVLQVGMGIALIVFGCLV
ncbi:MAG: hypothetical protein KDD62_16410, partial [Bdellovibrionales bacterium]|nr:hypothetical protein [Bdellovibrionales bacterium]